MTTRRAFLGTLGSGLLAAPLAAEGQQARKIARMGSLTFGPAPSPERLAELTGGPFWEGMRALGWVQGQNVIVERRFGESVDQLRGGAADLARLKVDVLYTLSAPLAKILQSETKTIPIVVATAGGDLVAAGLAASLARPGGNITGIQILGDELISKRFELLREPFQGRVPSGGCHVLSGSSDARPI